MASNKKFILPDFTPEPAKPMAELNNSFSEPLADIPQFCRRKANEKEA